MDQIPLEPTLTQTKTGIKTKTMVAGLVLLGAAGLFAGVAVRSTARTCNSGPRAGQSCTSHSACQGRGIARDARCVVSTTPSPTPTPSSATPTGVCNSGPNSGILCTINANCQPDTSTDSRDARCLPFTSGPTNSVASVVHVLIGLYDNTKYNLILDDPEGVRQFLFTKANGESLFGGGSSTSRSCRTHIENYIEGVGVPATLLPSDFPLSVSVIDCSTPPSVSLLTVPMPPPPSTTGGGLLLTVSPSVATPSGGSIPGFNEVLRFTISATAGSGSLHGPAFGIISSDNNGTGTAGGDWNTWQASDEAWAGWNTSDFRIYDAIDLSTPLSGTWRLFSGGIVGGEVLNDDADTARVVDAAQIDFTTPIAMTEGTSKTFILHMDTTGASAPYDDTIRVDVVGFGTTGAVAGGLPVIGGTLTY